MTRRRQARPFAEYRESRLRRYRNVELLEDLALALAICTILVLAAIVALPK